MMVGDRQITTLIFFLLSSLNLCDISYFYCSPGFKKKKKEEKTFIPARALLLFSVFGCSAGQPTTWWFSDEPIFTLLMLLHLSFCFTG